MAEIIIVLAFITLVTTPAVLVFGPPDIDFLRREGYMIASFARKAISSGAAHDFALGIFGTTDEQTSVLSTSCLLLELFFLPTLVFIFLIRALLRLPTPISACFNTILSTAIILWGLGVAKDHYLDTWTPWWLAQNVRYDDWLAQLLLWARPLFASFLRRTCLVLWTSKFPVLARYVTLPVPADKCDPLAMSVVLALGLALSILGAISVYSITKSAAKLCVKAIRLLSVLFKMLFRIAVSLAGALSYLLRAIHCILLRTYQVLQASVRWLRYNCGKLKWVGWAILKTFVGGFFVKIGHIQYMRPSVFSVALALRSYIGTTPKDQPRAHTENTLTIIMGVARRTRTKKPIFLGYENWMPHVDVRERFARPRRLRLPRVCNTPPFRRSFRPYFGVIGSASCPLLVARLSEGYQHVYVAWLQICRPAEYAAWDHDTGTVTDAEPVFLGGPHVQWD
ncbi:hypothetical protein C8R46DRAFT_1188004 [Mycena filopes]|nr:hypothetical protein C8R46DRAFT_1188004 [Mycena filopes]